MLMCLSSGTVLGSAYCSCSGRAFSCSIHRNARLPSSSGVNFSGAESARNHYNINER